MHRVHTTVAAPDHQLIDALQTPTAFDHPVTVIEMIETHISWVILTDDYAYKIKKPIRLDFLDFSDLERRKFYCDEELRLNKPGAPAIYCDVVPVTLQHGQPRFGGPGEPIEFAVRMHRFDQELRLDRQLAANRLAAADMKELGQAIASHHAQAQRIDVRHREHQLDVTKTFMRDNLLALEGYVDSARLSALTNWTEGELTRLDGQLARRFDAGFVRDCHGDLHLANLVRLPTGIVLFDCIEFNADLRAIDVFCDIAFLIMDLVAEQRQDLAAHFLNRYLECSGDYDGVALLDLYFVYRSLVRAKVAAISSQECEPGIERDRYLLQAQRYCDIAWRQASRGQPILVVMHGLSGSGKSWLAAQLLAALPAIRVRSDIERKRLFGIPECALSASAVGGGIYTEPASAAVYALLRQSAATMLQNGHSVILDAAFLRRAERQAALQVATSVGVPAVLLQIEAPVAILRERIVARAAAAADASEAGLAVLEHQLETAESLEAGERALAIVCANDGAFDIDAIVEQIKSRRRLGQSEEPDGHYSRSQHVH
jgi:aminoglycoside phosphotransferase family enzyme